MRNIHSHRVLAVVVLIVLLTSFSACIPTVNISQNQIEDAQTNTIDGTNTMLPDFEAPESPIKWNIPILSDPIAANFKDPEALTAFREVMLNDAPFFDEWWQDYRTISQYLEPSIYDGWYNPSVIFAICDMDNDGNPEVVLWFAAQENDYYSTICKTIVLRYSSGEIHGYPMGNITGFRNLKTDGTFEYAENAAGGGICYLNFSFSYDLHNFHWPANDTEGFLNRFTYTEPGSTATWADQVIIVNRQVATREEIVLVTRVQSNKTDVLWYSYTNGNINAALPDVD